MNSINFAKTAPAHRQQEIGRWKRFSLFALCVVLSGSCYTLFFPARALISAARALYETQRQIKAVPKALLAEQQTLKNSIGSIKRKHDTLKKWVEHPRLFLPRIDGVLTALGEKNSLESIKIDQTRVMLDVSSTSTASVMGLLEKLSSIQEFPHVQLASIQVTHGALPVRATIHATCKKS